MKMLSPYALVAQCLVAFFWVSALTGATMEIPPSFSAVHKTSYLKENSPIESVLKVLSSYEIDSHIEVVLVGDAFTPAILDELSRSLKVLSDVAAAASPLKFVHEQLVYHVSSGVGLEAKIRLLLQDKAESVAIDPIGEVLGQFHAQSATPTTIFVLHSGSLNSHRYTGAIPTCPQRTFLAREGYALIDLSARAEVIRSVAAGNDHIVSETEFKFLTPDRALQSSGAMHTSIHDLAALIHQSGEAMVPFPIFSSDLALFGDSSASSVRKAAEIGETHHSREVHYVDEEAPVQDTTIIEVVVFTLCMNSELCDDDVETKHAVEGLLTELSGDTHNVRFSAFHFAADTDPQIAHAIHSATSYSAQGSPDILKLSSKELLFWMSSSKTVRNILSRQGRYYQKATEFKKRIFPVFVIQLPYGVDLILDGEKQVTAQPFPEPAGGWLTDDEEASSMFSLHRQKVFESDWPSTAAVALHTPGRSLSIPPVLECAGYWLPRGPADYVAELVDVVKTAVWGILPSHIHYSSSSRGLVKDYLWSVPPAMRMLLDQKKGDQYLHKYSFRERRQIHRHNIIHACDRIIGAFSDILLDASTVRPAVNISSILGMKEHKPTGDSNRVASVYNPFTATTNKNEAKDILKKDGKNIPLFEKFLKHLDLAASAFSHLQYSDSQGHLKDASVVQVELKRLVDSLLSMRTGSFTCKDMRKETKLQSLENKREGIPEKEYKFEKGPSEKKNQSRRIWTWVFGVFGSILVGCVVGYDVATSKSRRALL